jgi:NMD protein affecting ribosome stability and mRNA decay
MDDAEWELAAGDPCRKCGATSLRLFDGLCPGCYSEQSEADVEKMERKAIRQALRRGEISISELKGERR